MRTVQHLRYAYAAPAGCAMTSADAVRLARTRRQKAEKELLRRVDARQAWKLVRIHRLDNPYMADHAWRLMLNLAKRGAR